MSFLQFYKMEDALAWLLALRDGDRLILGTNRMDIGTIDSRKGPRRCFVPKYQRTVMMPCLARPIKLYWCEETKMLYCKTHKQAHPIYPKDIIVVKPDEPLPALPERSPDEPDAFLRGVRDSALRAVRQREQCVGVV